MAFLRASDTSTSMQECRGIVEGLALLMRTTVSMVEVVQLLQLILHRLGVLKELVQDDISMT
jgi:DNA repair protein RadC